MQAAAAAAAAAACLAAAAGSRAAPAAPAAPAPAPVDAAFFTGRVQPLLQRSCLGCHGVGARLSGLDLRTRESALKGGTRGPALVPGSAARSLLYRLASGRHAPLMPPQGRLPAADLALLRRWLDGGAPWAGAPVESARKQVWWSFRVPAAPPVPVLADAAARRWIRTPVDAFVLAKLRERGLEPNPPASRRVLIRRAYLDLTGLPPTPEEVRAFERDPAPDAWEKVVDRLLASPHYGERWGRHWLDLVRYADSSGFEGDKDRPLAWRYRDYVVRSFNEDLPYDRFLREQLAGDELPGPPERRNAAIVATGYLACGQEDFAMAKLPMTRADELDDLVSTTASVFLGLTVGCARCHDHKYDPVSQEDYYRLQALFAPTVRRELEIATDAERREAESRNAALDRELAPLRVRLGALRERGAAASGQQKPTDDQVRMALAEPERAEWDALRGRLQEGEARRVHLPKAMAVTDQARSHPPVRLLLRGDANHPGPEVRPGFIRALPGGEAEVGPESATAAATGRRLALAEWLASPGNPLPARVWVNRVWRQHFGRGIVATPSNFGLNGDLPTHPGLLDYLAGWFESPSGAAWRAKPLHRLLLLSAAYRQSSRVRPEAARKDPQNRWLWRVPLRRLEAEAIRDGILAVSGTLNREMGGPPVYPPVDPSLRADTFQGINWPEGEDGPKTWRRSLYVKVKRSLLFPQLEVFDCPEITASVAARNVTTTPNQALALLNDPLVLRQARHFAARVEREAGADPRRQAERAYLLAVCRPPTARESVLAVRFLKGPPSVPGGSRLAEFCHAVLNLSEFIYVP